jgi:uncharacterized protein (DUF1919 family)
MYLPLHSFNARVEHEHLKYIAIVNSDDNHTKNMINVLKQLNYGKDVIYTCAEIENCPMDAYKNLTWLFAYNTTEECEEVIEMLFKIGMNKIDNFDITKEASCPFMS